MRKLLAWLKAVLNWLVEWKLFCLGSFVVAASVGFSVFVYANDQAILITGMLLQLLGIGTVAWGIRSTRINFNIESAFTVWRKRLNRFPLLSGNGITASSDIALPPITGSGCGHSSANVGKNPTIDERIRALEDNLNLLSARVTNTQIEMDEEFRKQAHALKQEQQNRFTEDQLLHADMKKAITGGLHISAMGTLWLVFGVIMSSIPYTLAEWFK